MSERVQITYLVGLVIVTVAMAMADCQIESTKAKNSAQDHGTTTEGGRKVQGRGDPGAD